MSEIVTPAELFTSCEWEPMAWHWMEPDMGYRCTEPGCGFDVPCDRNGGDSYQFRAEEHARLTGHRVGFYLERFEHFPDGPAWMVGEGVT